MRRSIAYRSFAIALFATFAISFVLHHSGVIWIPVFDIRLSAGSEPFAKQAAAPVITAEDLWKSHCETFSTKTATDVVEVRVVRSSDHVDSARR